MEVKICSNKIDELCDNLSKMELKFHTWDDPQFLNCNDINKITQFFFIGNAINFRFWYTSPKERYTYSNYDGSAAMWAFLKDNIKLIDSNYISKLELENEPELKKMPMALERVIALRETGKVLLRNFDGSALKICELGEWHAPTIVKTITQYFPTWRDEQQNYEFNKRAQLFVCMLHGKMGNNSKITDIDKLTCLADYQLPKVLEYFGVLQYSKKLKEVIESETLIPAGSNYEFLIRSSTIQAIKLICDKLNKHQLNVSPVQLDYILWKLARNIPNNHHLTVTMAY